MSKVTFKDRDLYSSVIVDGKVVGHILRRLAGGWFYQPANAGKKFATPDRRTRDEVKRDITA